MGILNVTAAELGWAIDAGKVDPVDITKAFLSEIEASPHKDDIYVRVSAERALKEAQNASNRAKSGMRKSPFDGVPVSWKDLFDTADIKTEGGTKLLEGRKPNEDCQVVRRATHAGMVCLGKTHLSELAFSGLGINPMTKTSPNRYDDKTAPGGSSSGAAASVAFDLAPISIGSDTGGSVRIPAAWNGLVGLKTTHGAVSLEGVIPLCSSFDTVGPLCRSVEDAALMHQILSGENININTSPDLPNVKLLVCETAMLDNCENSQLQAFETALGELKKAGAQIEYGKIPELEEMVKLGPVMFPHEAYNQWGEAIEKAPEKMFEPVLNRFRAGKKISPQQDADARARMMELRASYLQRTSKYDAILAPTTPIAPPQIQPLLDDHDLFWDTNLMALSNTRYANMFGLCALTLPTGTQAAGLMLMAAPNQEERLLQMGLAMEPVVAV
ncbi:MAG: hypothetical protein L3J32_06410 [Rhizobiaceae bacterium]|nr:hypothetical protein [Rhizobiaceae bacterium]